jgi:predicted esterase
LHQNPVLEWVAEEATTLNVILIHGRGGSARDMGGLAHAIEVTGVRFLMPSADGNSWYPQRFIAPIEQNEPYLSAALEHIESVVTRLLDAGEPAGRIVIGGFSQGACLTSEFLARCPRRYGGALILTGGLIGPEGTEWPVEKILDGMPVYLASGEVDPHIPVERALETAEWLKQCGAQVDVDIFPTRPHTVSAREIEKARALLLSLA